MDCTKQRITEQIRDMIRAYEKSTVTKWGDPLVGFAGAAKVAKLRGIVSPGHAQPEQILPGAETVISYFVPFLEETAQTNTAAGLASPQWAQAYEETNVMLACINEQLICRLKEEGIRGRVPQEAAVFDRELLRSDWSQRHIAYLAGLGTFGLNNMLITEKGCCGRISSIVTDLKIAPDVPMTKELCIYKQAGKCGICADRCEAGALTRQAYDRKKCYEICLKNAKVHNHYGSSYTSSDDDSEEIGSEVCGKCIAGMPCAFKK